MKGIEAVEITLSECKSIIDFRIDANTYKKEYLKCDILIKSKNPSSIESISTSVQNFGAYSLCNSINFTETGIPFLMTENIRHNYINWNIQKYVDNESHKMLYKSHCNKGQVLVTMAGEYLGRVAVYDKNEICSSNQAIAKITLTSKENPYIISTFLNSKYGQNQINRFKTITGQPNINMSLIKSLLIPFFTEKFQKEIENLILNSELKTSKSKELYQQSEDLLLSELGMKDWKPTEENVSVKTFANFANADRFDAEYFQPKYDELENKIKKHKFAKLADIVNIKKSIEPGSKAYQDNGIPFIRVSNLSKEGLSQPSIHLSPKISEKIEELKPKKDTILLSKDGTVGIAYKVEKDLEIITSGAILHLTIKDNETLPDYLTLVLNSIITQMQADRDAGGSIIKHWRLPQIENVLIPILDKKIQQEISKNIQESFALKEKSKHLLESAKLAVEKAIEQDETIALNWLENEIGES